MCSYISFCMQRALEFSALIRREKFLRDSNQSQRIYLDRVLQIASCLVRLYACAQSRVLTGSAVSALLDVVTVACALPLPPPIPPPRPLKSHRRPLISIPKYVPVTGNVSESKEVTEGI